MESERLQFSIDLAGLISLLAKNLYTEPDVFVRELIQNAHDSIIRRKSSSPEEVFDNRITIRTDIPGRSITFEDNGCGLTREDIVTLISTIGRSGTNEVRRALAESDREMAEALIGQFGIGLLSSFIVANIVELNTLAPDGTPLRWTSDGGPTYELSPSDRTAVGTAVRLHLKPEYLSFLADDTLAESVRRYTDYLGLPVYINNASAPANAVDAPWHTWDLNSPTIKDDCYIYWERRFRRERSLYVFPVDEEYNYIEYDQTRSGRVQGILGVTDRHTPDMNIRGTVDLFVRRVLIATGNKSILPGWAKFIQGVIECNALTPNAARDNVMADQISETVRQVLERVIIRELRELSKVDPLRFKEIMEWHSYHVLGMAVQDEYEEFFQQIADLVPLPSDVGPLTLPEYIAASPRRTDGVVLVHYLVDRQASNQYFMLSQAKGMRIYNCSQLFAERFLTKYAETWPDRIALDRIDISSSAGGIFEDLTSEERTQYAYLEDALRHALNDPFVEVQTSKFEPPQVPAVITSSRGSKVREEATTLAADPSLPDIYRSTIRDLLTETVEASVLRINANSTVIQKLSQQGPSVAATNQGALMALINNARLLSARLLSGELIAKMFAQYSVLIEQFVSLAEESEALERRLNTREAELIEVRASEGPMALTPYVQCFVAMSYSQPWAAKVSESLHSILEAAPYYWRVIRADDKTTDAVLWNSIKNQMLGSHCFVALVGDDNPNVCVEIGRMEAIGRPMLLVKGAPSDLPSDLKGRVYIEIDPDARDLQKILSGEISKNDMFRDQLGLPYLSKAALEECGVGGEAGTRIMAAFETWDAYLAAEVDEIARITNVNPALARAVQVQLGEMHERIRRGDRSE
jgi:molecular chaperone HtpG